MLKRIEGSILVHKGMDGVGQQGTAILIASIGSFISIAVSMIGTLSNYISNHFNSKPSQITELILGAYSWPLYLLIILVMIISVYWIGSYLNRQKRIILVL
ncbi:hypothetical protein P343_07635 [Sporolactobacillus laevolacticus DSM 442]|uniref:Uncharacterized protein n=1 Tax=Sporolactobacillus laevolacticus DSM 442 TaxID=1395513 RepID=V6IXU9_9BACL|nr:hypothetical protein P343_07635 [Sporolactobacillus laevolacticus DSM 442]